MLEYTEKQLLTFPGAGKGTIKEIENILYDLGLRLTSKVNFETHNDKTKKVQRFRIIRNMKKIRNKYFK